MKMTKFVLYGIQNKHILVDI